jgi:hypothetical protein
MPSSIIVIARTLYGQSRSEDDAWIIFKSSRAIRFWPCDGVFTYAPPYRYDSNIEWVEGVSDNHRRRVCWLPADYRVYRGYGPLTAAYRNYFAMGRNSHELTILDFSKVKFA